MSDKALRAGLIRLAHSHPEFRKDLLPIITACGVEGPMQGKFEEGKPADPTENMSPEDAAEWKKQTELNKDKFKGAAKGVEAGCEKLPEGGMRDNCEKKQEEGDAKGKEAGQKSAGMVAITKAVKLAVRVMSKKPMGPGQLGVTGMISFDFGKAQPEGVKFAAVIESLDKGQYTVLSFKPVKTVSGAGAELVMGVVEAAFEEAIATKGAALLGDIA